MKRVFLLASIIVLMFSLLSYAGEKKASKPAKNITTGIKFEVIPAENTIAFIDGKKVGEITKIDVVPVKAGKHTIKLLHNKDEVEVDVVVVNKQILNFKYAFEDSGKGIGGFSNEEKEEDNSAREEKDEKQTEKRESPESQE
ncbi:MAG: hypothetical protein ACP5QK_10970 [Myxococcota bacterium]